DVREGNMLENVRRGAILLAVLIPLLSLGCETDKPTDTPAPKEKQPEAKKVLVAPNVFLEVQGDRRRVLISASVCMQKGALELFLTKKGTKEHEAVVTAEIDARKVHEALLLAKGEPGAPVKYDPKYTPATGQVIKVTVTYELDGKLHTVP